MRSASSTSWERKTLSGPTIAAIASRTRGVTRLACALSSTAGGGADSPVRGRLAVAGLRVEYMSAFRRTPWCSKADATLRHARRGKIFKRLAEVMPLKRYRGLARRGDGREGGFAGPGGCTKGCGH